MTSAIEKNKENPLYIVSNKVLYIQNIRLELIYPDLTLTFLRNRHM